MTMHIVMALKQGGPAILEILICYDYYCIHLHSVNIVLAQCYDCIVSKMQVQHSII